MMEDGDVVKTLDTEMWNARTPIPNSTLELSFSFLQVEACVVLNSILEKPVIYKTDEFRAVLETPARNNIKRELAIL